MEELRRKLANNANLYPQPVGGFRQPAPAKPISVSSTSSSDSRPPARGGQGAREVYVISDSDDEAPIPSKTNATAAGQALKPRLNYQDIHHPPVRTMPAKPIQIPSNKDLTQPPRPKAPQSNHAQVWETFREPDDAGLFDPRKTAAEAEKDLKDLLQQSFDGREEGEEGKEEPIDMKEATVAGFREGIQLLPHQVVGRKWMAERESGKKLGGILADDMGLGKTIQTLNRIVDGRPRKSDRADGWAASTLVVCPVGLVSQWAAEVQKMAVGLTVIEHHGASRATDPAALQRAHVVVTSYATVASEHSAFAPEAKDESKPKSKSKKAAAAASDSDESSSEAEHFGRTLAAKKKATTSKSKKKDALFRVKWWRIVLDEAHNIKNRNTKAALGCCALEGKYRWCLTGTPLQNNVEELYSLLKFLRIRPLNDWQTFNEQINKPVKSGKPVRAMKRLHVVLRAVMLRRRKTDLLNGKPLLDLPERRLSIVPCEFDDEEREFYFALENKIEAAMEKFVKSGDVMRNYTNVMVLLLRLRQACNHPSLVSKNYNADRDAVEPRAATKDDEDDDADGLASMLGGMGLSGGKKCQLCQAELMASNIASDEEHCTDCVELTRAARRKSLARANGSNLPPDSAKIRKIVELLNEINAREDEDGELIGEKTIVFSQFTSMLDLIEIFLKDAGMSFVRYDGSMTKDKREASIEKIKTSKSVKIILISFKAGSTGLNLTACNNVILVDMWWNPALEEQAFDRAHRYGQTRDVNIYKLTIEKTVEERILTLQEQKRALAAAALSGDKVKNMKLGLEDLMALFRPGRDEEEED
ncbi:hypothetical protein BV25DRAFT_1830155 [Artomyces pyxidatus]|uniref:Uncharacterized protein n=1 Tax=Artomyces pyxidatus TaxID=48021 RepID=A0ACB8SPA3_9AGAM|nr:hypothetical protein BV25DRAFT_1830155 [Artomyces pyxidatus]